MLYQVMKKYKVNKKNVVVYTSYESITCMMNYHLQMIYNRI